MQMAPSDRHEQETMSSPLPHEKGSIETVHDPRSTQMDQQTIGELLLQHGSDENGGQAAPDAGGGSMSARSRECGGDGSGKSIRDVHPGSVQQPANVTKFNNANNDDKNDNHHPMGPSDPRRIHNSLKVLVPIAIVNIAVAVAVAAAASSSSPSLTSTSAPPDQTSRISNILTPTTCDQIKQTLNIIQSKARSRNPVLVSLPIPNDSTTIHSSPNSAHNLLPPLALYRWLLPRLIYSSALLSVSQNQTAKAIGKDIEETVVDVLRALGDDLGTDSSSSSHGAGAGDDFDADAEGNRKEGQGTAEDPTIRVSETVKGLLDGVSYFLVPDTNRLDSDGGVGSHGRSGMGILPNHDGNQVVFSILNDSRTKRMVKKVLSRKGSGKDVGDLNEILWDKTPLYLLPIGLIPVNLSAAATATTGHPSANTTAQDTKILKLALALTTIKVVIHAFSSSDTINHEKIYLPIPDWRIYNSSLLVQVAEILERLVRSLVRPCSSFGGGRGGKKVGNSGEMMEDTDVDFEIKKNGEKESQNQYLALVKTLLEVAETLMSTSRSVSNPTPTSHSPLVPARASTIISLIVADLAIARVSPHNHISRLTATILTPAESVHVERMNAAIDSVQRDNLQRASQQAIDESLGRLIRVFRLERVGRIGGKFWSRLVDGINTVISIVIPPELSNQPMITQFLASILLPPGHQSTLIAHALSSAKAQSNLSILRQAIDTNQDPMGNLQHVYQSYLKELKQSESEPRGRKRKVGDSGRAGRVDDMGMDVDVNVDIDVDIAHSVGLLGATLAVSLGINKTFVSDQDETSLTGNIDPLAFTRFPHSDQQSLGQGEKHPTFTRLRLIVAQFQGLHLNQQGKICSTDPNLTSEIQIYVDLNTTWVLARPQCTSVIIEDVVKELERVDGAVDRQTMIRLTVEAIRSIACYFCLADQCERGCPSVYAAPFSSEKHSQQGDPGNSLQDWVALAQSLLSLSVGGDSAVIEETLLALRNTLRHRGEREILGRQNSGSTTLAFIATGLEEKSRRRRVLAGQCLFLLFEATVASRGISTASLEMLDFVQEICANIASQPLPRLETTFLALTEIAKHAEGKLLGFTLEQLLLSLGTGNAGLHSLSRVQLASIVKHRQKTAYALTAPFIPQLAPKLVVSDIRSLNGACDFLGLPVASFLESTMQHILPALVVQHNQQALGKVAAQTGRTLGVLMVDHMHLILAAIFLQPDAVDVDNGVRFVVQLVNSLSNARNAKDVSISTLISIRPVPFLVEIVIQLGDPATIDTAEEALRRIQEYQNRCSVRASQVTHELGTYLKPQMLAIISLMNDLLQEVNGKKTAEEKRKVIRSFGELISKVGDSMMSFSPQIMACIQGSLNIRELRLDSLRTLQNFVGILRFEDIGPYVGTVVAATTSVWDDMSTEERLIATKIVEYLLADNVESLKRHLEDVISLDHIPKLKKAAAKLNAIRREWSFRERLQNLLVRANNYNVAISSRSLVELKILIDNSWKDFMDLAKGDTFDALVGDLYRTLLLAASRDGEHCQALRDASLECMGIVGAVDPDRFPANTAQTIVIVKTGFVDNEESIDFVLHLIEDVLVGAFRTTNDTKHQSHLAFAIQELLKFCGFSAKLVQSGGTVGTISNKVRARWAQLPKHLLETLTPLLEARFSTNDVPIKQFQYPIYMTAPTYREWIQRWTTDLIGKVMNMEEPLDPTLEKEANGIRNAKLIFGVFRGVLPRGQDVTVAHHILPHIVLHLLTITEEKSDISNQILEEVLAVLSDKDNMAGEGRTDRRLLSAQAVFELLDHLSRWLQEQRGLLHREPRKRKDGVSERQDSNWLTLSRQNRKIDRFLKNINPEVTAQAAVQCQAYARALRNFEERIGMLRQDKKFGDKELENYYEQLHSIYADLEEPDGMLGVSTKIISPSLEHQIREHESVGRWTSAQSCWEVRLQQYPEELNSHLGLLGCLRSLGHYDTLRTHIRGILSKNPQWGPQLASYQVEAAWIVGDWNEVDSIINSEATGAEISIAKVLLSIQQRRFDDIPIILRDVRRDLGCDLAGLGRQYARAYPVLANLHKLHEVERISSSGHKMAQPMLHNRERAVRHQIKQLNSYLAQRFATTLPSFRVREPLLSIRRTAFQLSPATEVALKAEVGRAWIATAKIARKGGFEQTAYSAILQAKESNAEFAFVQQVKLLKATGHPLQALSDLENGLRPILRPDAPLGGSALIDLSRDPDEQKAYNSQLAKAITLSARWAYETDRFDANEVVKRFKDASALAPMMEGPYYHLGYYYDLLSQDSASRDKLQQLTVENYAQALRFGTKNIYQTMPRMLTIWLDLGEKVAMHGKKGSTEAPSPDASEVILAMNGLMDKANGQLPVYQWLTAFPQIVSRITHPNKGVRDVLKKIIPSVVAFYPRQATWSMVGLYNSKSESGSDKSSRCKEMFDRAKSAVKGDPMARQVIQDAIKFSATMLQLSTDDGIDPTFNPKTQKHANHNRHHLSISANFPYVKNAFPTTVILPLQDSLTCTLPSSAETVKTHNPFPDGFVTIKEITDGVEVMTSLQRPKKITFKGDDGKRYNFLVKPHDDLRKDARLMDFNSMINKLLKSDSEARKRKLYIRTYAVSPLNEECGMLEWVNNTVPLKSILAKQYDRQNKKAFSNDIYAMLDRSTKKSLEHYSKVFKEQVLPRFSPPVFSEWFYQTWPEPNAWFAARLAYARTLAVMSMVGFVLGLGDRHGENILFDSMTGDTVHVDFNCLFEKGKTFEVAERTPFRLTHNMVDALGVTGVDGVYRRAAEIALTTLRTNRDSLTSVLEAFVHDPLVEWEELKRKHEDRERRKGGQHKVDLRTFANNALTPIKDKLSGTWRGTGASTNGIPASGMSDSRQGEMSVVNQVESLIKEATSPLNLGNMYIGWAAWL